MNRWMSVLAGTLLAFCIGVAPASATEFPDEFMVGMNLTAEEAEALEERLERNPQDLQARSQLLIYYFPKSHLDPAIRRIRHQHVLWLIRNAPQADVLALPYAQIQPFFDAASYKLAKDAWVGHMEREPTNVTFVANAANFFFPIQDRQLVVETLQKAQSLDPENSRWPTLLGHLYLRDALFGEQLGNLEMPEGLAADDLPSGLANLFGQASPESPSSTLLALEQFERAYELAGSDIERAHALVPLAKAAFEAERYDDARTYATAMLDEPPNGWDEGNQLHHGNIVLGRVALVEDDVAQAKYHLLEAGKVSGSPQLGSFGPNMRLAAELLERGERDVVLEYFELCSNFWPRDKLKDWAALVEAGRTPDFGGNLVY